MLWLVLSDNTRELVTGVLPITLRSTANTHGGQTTHSEVRTLTYESTSECLRTLATHRDDTFTFTIATRTRTTPDTTLTVRRPCTITPPFNSSNAITVFLLTIFIVGVLLVLIVVSLLTKHRQHKVVRASSYPLCVVMLAGAALGFVHVYTVLVYPPTTQALCVAQPFTGLCVFCVCVRASSPLTSSTLSLPLSTLTLLTLTLTQTLNTHTLNTHTQAIWPS